MNTQRLHNNYHDAHLERVALGPHHDVTLFLHLDPAWNTSIARDAVVRFGEIVNYAEVEAYFAALPKAALSGACMAAVSNLEQGPRGGWLIDVEGYGRLSIMSGRCIEKRR